MWEAFPADLKPGLANDLCARLRDNLTGAGDQVEACMGYLWALQRGVAPPYVEDRGVLGECAGFCPGAASADFRSPEAIWLPNLLAHLAAHVRAKANEAPGQTETETRKILSAAIPAGLKGKRQEFSEMEKRIRVAYPEGATVRARAHLLGATWSLRTLLDVANHVVTRSATRTRPSPTSPRSLLSQRLFSPVAWAWCRLEREDCVHG